MIYGITGGIGSGKSYVSKILEELDIPVFDSDKEAKKLYTEDNTLKSELISIYGDSIYTDDGYINRKKLASIIFSDPSELRRVNNMVHPRLRNKFVNWTKQMQNEGYHNMAIESAIMFEGNLNKLVDKVIVVTAPLQVRIDRVKERDNASYEEIKSRIDKQTPQNKIIELSDFTIDNSGNKLIIPQIIDILNI